MNLVCMWRRWRLHRRMDQLLLAFCWASSEEERQVIDVEIEKVRCAIDEV